MDVTTQNEALCELSLQRERTKRIQTNEIRNRKQPIRMFRMQNRRNITKWDIQNMNY